ncbi:MAG: methyltransferase domain-containing protein [Sporomusaceae bacterium]|nr:methyltransferase domain-containing protein [Sporomusaceae bacterium]
MTERVAFLLRFLMDPKKIGSVTPSSEFLTRQMLDGLAWKELSTIVELGAGTGVFTRYIADHKREASRVVVIEQDSMMRRRLRQRYPDFYFGRNAEGLEALLQTYRLGQADCIVSGLPFAAFPDERRRLIVAAVRRSLNPEGTFVAFQYSLQLHSLLRHYFREVRVKFVWLNMPPAFVYFCKV